MFTSRYLNNALNSMHEWAFRLIYNDYDLPFDRILEDSKQKGIRQKNTELLTIEIYKIQVGLLLSIMSGLFVTRENKYNLSSTRIFTQTNSKIWHRNYFLQETSNMEPDPGKIRDIVNIDSLNVKVATI